ncbi:serine-rich adhesin for platelets isoform X2 [Anopheles stephensi]|nr:serine-rich adhesin for platelets isoform X2 [Anopheles stephensi]
MESYQGLVGRPGIDFPVLTHIPKTIFDCKNHGNGYFADLETRCQVFHICDDGKKISFLCPNGTIFRQLDLICDWWFKVDCAATPNHFAESTEMLTQAKRARLQSKHPVPQPITQSDERLTLNIQDKRLLLGNTNSLRTAKTPTRNTLELNRRMDRIVSAESNGFGSNRNGKTFKDNTDKSYVADEIQETSQSASFASIANKMFNTYYAQEQLLKDQANGNKLRRNESYGDDASRDYLLVLSKDARDENISSSSSSISTSGNRHAMNYMPYTTARKLNLNSKVTQFYTPTVPTFTTSTRTTTVGAISEDAMVTTKATTINGFISGGTVGSQSFGNQFAHPMRREGTADEETIMDHAMEIMQTIKNLKIDESASNGDAVKQTIDDVMATASSSTNTFNGPTITFSTIASPTKVSYEFLQHPSEIGPIVDRFRRMRIAAERRPKVDVGHRSLLTRTTLNEYDRLFQTKDNENGGNRIDDVHDHEHNHSETEFYMDSQMEHDLEGQSSRYPVFGMSNSTQIRELAQIFTHALSAYLQDPVTFRRILTEIRPKAPGTQTLDKSFTMERTAGAFETSVPSLLETTTYSSHDNAIQRARLQDGENYEVLDFSDLSTTTTTVNPTDKETTVVDTTTATPPTTTIDSSVEYNKVSFLPKDTSRKQGKSLSIKFITNSRNELADEVNSELGTPASFSYTNRFADHASAEHQADREAGDVTTITTANRLDTKAPTVSSALPTATASVVTEPVSAPQSVLKPPVISSSRYSSELKPKTTLVLEDDEQLQRAQSESIVSSQNNRPIYERNKYSVISLHNFRDNPTTGVTSGSLVNQTPIATVQPSANLQQEPDGIVPASRTTMSYTVFFDPLTINDELMELEKPKPTEAHTPEIHVVRQYGWNGTLLKPGAASAPNVAEENYSTRLMSENMRENSTLMQKKANEMFGELNDAQADKLMTAIKMADKDKSMRRLILLLIRTCDDTPTSTNEESRKALLEALINIGGVMNTQSADDLRIASDNQAPDTDYRRGKEIGYNRDANLVHAAGSVIKSTTPNMAATTENYAKVSTADANDGSNSKERDSQERFNSEEWLKDNDVQTTEATTKMFVTSSEGQTNYLSNTVTTQARWAYDYENTHQPQSTTTPYPSTAGQTTDDGRSTVFTTIAEPIVSTTLTANPTSEAFDNPSSTTLQTTVDTIDTEYRSVESIESDTSSEFKPPFIVSQRLPKDLSSSLAYPSSKKNKYNSPHNSDTRALELLKSLYSLAARWG